MSRFTWDEALDLVHNSLPLFKENFENNGYLVPIVFLVIGNDLRTKEPLEETQVAFFPLPVGEEGAPFFPVDALRDAARAFDARAYVLACHIHGAELEDGVPTGKCSDSLLVVLEHRDTGKLATWSCDVIGGPILYQLADFKPVHQVSIQTPLSGLFSATYEKMN